MVTVFQHFLTMVGGDLAVTMVFSEAMCVTNMLDKARIFGTVLFGNGLATILQSVVGSRWGFHFVIISDYFDKYKLRFSRFTMFSRKQICFGCLLKCGQNDYHVYWKIIK